MLRAARATPDWKGKLSSECLLSDYFNLLLDVNLNELTPSSRWTESNHRGGLGGCGKKGGAQKRGWCGTSLCGFANFCKDSVIDRGAGSAFHFPLSITIISWVILCCLFIRRGWQRKPRKSALEAPWQSTRQKAVTCGERNRDTTTQAPDYSFSVFRSKHYP